MYTTPDYKESNMPSAVFPSLACPSKYVKLPETSLHGTFGSGTLVQGFYCFVAVGTIARNDYELHEWFFLPDRGYHLRNVHIPTSTACASPDSTSTITIPTTAPPVAVAAEIVDVESASAVDDASETDALSSSPAAVLPAAYKYVASNAMRSNLTEYIYYVYQPLSYSNSVMLN